MPLNSKTCGDRFMTYLEAAYQILREAGEPLHYREITQRALAKGLLQPSGLTPDATMGSRLYTDTKQDESRFVRAGRGLFGLAERQAQGIDAQISKINQATRSELQKRLHVMPPDRFEALVGELLIQMGFDENTVTVTQRSSDGGIDVVGTYRAAGLTEVNAAVQVKRWKGNVQAPVVTQLRGSLQVHQQGIIITTSDFSKGARKEASAPGKTHIGLINGKELLELLIKHRVGVAEKTLKVLSLDDEWWGELLTDGEHQPEFDSPKPTPTTYSPVSGTKPTGCTLLGQFYPVHSWKELLLTACSALAQRHGDEFPRQALTIKGRTRQYIAARPDGMTDPARIPETDLWVETNHNAKSVVRLVKKLLTAFGHDPDEPGVFDISFTQRLS